MAQIHILDSETIDKIAAGEVVERPASVVKELVENAIDASATAITVEAKDGGIEFIRVTDNGTGIEPEQLRRAFLRHATSKIENADDLIRIQSLGFRGEALSSISAVSRTEVITKCRNTLVGNRILLEGAEEKLFEEVGAPEGTTFMVRNLFYNTPVRRKFLKQPATEGSYIADLMEHMALSRPDIAFKLILGSQTKFHTSGNGELKEVIYRIYGREVAANLIPIRAEKNGICVEGYLGKPVLVRANRNFEIYFINGRFVRSSVIAKSIEEGFREYLMQHKFPFCVLHIKMDTSVVDVNVHPTKMDVRFSNTMGFSSCLTEIIKDTLKQQEMIPEVKENRSLEDQQTSAKKLILNKERTPEQFEINRIAACKVMEETKKNPVWARVLVDEATEITPIINQNTESEKVATSKPEDDFFIDVCPVDGNVAQKQSVKITASEQMNLFEEKLLSAKNRTRYRLLGQVFGTYWLVQFEDKLLIIDQHAAHEKIKFERLMKQYHEMHVMAQNLMPPVIVSLTGQEESILKEYMDVFASLGFEIESFGGNEYALRSVPVDLYGCSEREMFLEVLDELSESGGRNNLKVVEEKIASMACKAAVKGNHSISSVEAEHLIDELLTLDNPYHCPHGRPTIISMSKSELEKKFKRIV